MRFMAWPSLQSRDINIATFYVNGVEQISETAAVDAGLSKDLSRSLSRAVPNLVVGENILGVRLFKNGPGESSIFDGTFTLTSLNIFNHNPGSNQPVGMVYSFPVPAFSGLTTLKARARDNITGRWSALTEGSFDTGLLPNNLVICKFHYRASNPTPPSETAISTDRDDFEFIEFTNIGDDALDLTGYFFSHGITFSFPDATIIPAGRRALIVRNQSAFTARYGTLPTPIIGEYGGSLSNSGERITVNAPQGPVIDFTYDDQAPWPESADGDGPSLVLIAPSNNPNSTDEANWRLSSEIGGNPGTSDSTSLADWMTTNDITDLLDDPDQDGLNHLAEFAVGGDPFSFTPNTLQVQAPDSSGMVMLSARLDLAAMDEIGMTIERSFDLDNWDEATTEQTAEIYHNDGTITPSYSNQIGSSSRAFFRIAFWQR